MHTLIPIRSANLGNARMEGYNLNLIDNGDHSMKLSNNYDALVSALTLAITAPTDAKADQCIEIAEQMATGMSEIEVSRAKREAEQKANEVLIDET